MKNQFLKSPLNYVGGKHKLLPQIIPLFPEQINTFVDLFTGGCNVGINVKANKIICNDYESVIIDLYKDLTEINSTQAVKILKQTIDKYNLSKTNKEGYLKIRSDYNNCDRSWHMFYAMLTHGFNYSIRFNSKNEFNIAFGANRSCFNNTLEQYFVSFIDRLNESDITFTNNDFRKIKLEKLSAEDFIYCDPPYLITTANYNENGGWNDSLERELLTKLDEANEKGIRFALSNVLRDGDKSNEILIEWSKKYKIYNLNHNYGNANYHKKDKAKNKTEEVLIVNY